MKGQGRYPRKPQKDPAFKGFSLRPIRDLVGPENRPVLAVVAQNSAPFR